MESQKRILIVDDHPVCRQGVLKALSGHFGSDCSMFEAFDLASVLKLEAREKPDVIILDLEMPSASGLEILKKLREQNSPAKVVVFSQSEDILLRKDLLDLNVNAIVSKASSMSFLCDAVSCVTRNEFYLDPNLVEEDREGGLNSALTKREHEVVRLVSQGLTNKEVAEHLGCSDFTIKSHKSNIMRKIGVRNSAELVGWYFINHGKTL